MIAQIVKIDADALLSTDSNILNTLFDGPVRALEADEAIGMPTETVYGLAANCLRPCAASKIFKIKNRPMDNPLICHISSVEMLKPLVDPEFLSNIPERVQEVMKEFWPGPLTLLLPAHPELPECVTAGLKTVGVRFPAHKVAQELIARAGFPLAAPSANLSGRPSPTTAAHVFNDLHDRINWIVDGGNAGVGLESTVVDLLSNPPMILRPGGITQAMLKRIVPDIIVYRQKKQQQSGDCDENGGVVIDESKPPTPGMKYKHYAPTAPVWLFALKSPTGSVVDDSKNISPLIETYLRVHAQGKRIMRLCVTEGVDFEASESVQNIYLSRTGDMVEIAHNLFGGLREADESCPDVIVAEAVNEEDEGLAIMNRLIKSAGEEIIIL